MLTTLPLALAATLSRPTLARTTCEWRVEPASVSSEWDRAIVRARNELREAKGDCADVLVQIRAGGAVLTFTTSDGRRAVRSLGTPEELMPTLEALLIPLPADTVPASAVPEPRAPSPAQTAPDLPSVSRPSPDRGPAFWSALIGVRLAGPDAFLSPTLALGTSLALSRWEVGVIAAWSPDYQHLDTDDRPNAHLASIAAGVSAGRRVPMGKFTSLAGIHLSASILHEAWHVPTSSNGHHLEVERERGQALFGVYAGAVFPSTSKLRVKATLSGDVDATHLIDGDATPASDPALPWWGLTLTLGVEGDAF